MLPADGHVPLVERCLAARAHFVSSSYIAPEVRVLDPGIDHLMAHRLVADDRAAPEYDPATREGEAVWSRTIAMDACGDDRGSAMARLVSVPASLAVEAVAASTLPPA